MIPAKWLLIAAFVIVNSTSHAADVPSSPYLNYVYEYADTMLADGRDVYGPQQSGLFLSALERGNRLIAAVEAATKPKKERGEQ